MNDIRIGQGLDIHPFAKEPRPLMLGGVHIPDAPGLVGHSDADALIHAICDAILGALNLGDIGQHFPDTDPRYKGQASLFFLERIRELLDRDGWEIANVDSTVLTEAPMLKPHVPAMRRTLAGALRVEESRVSVKATRPEKLGAFGRREGLLVTAVVLLTKN